MTILDFIEAWWLSMQPLLKANNVIGRFERSATNRPNPSCCLNLRRGRLEADLLVWESGEAELATTDLDGSDGQQHFDDIREQAKLGIVLSQCAALLSSARRE